MEKGDLSKSFWNSTIGTIAKFAIGAIITYALFIPVDIYFDAARSAFIHSVQAEPLVNHAYGTVGGIIETIASMFGFAGEGPLPVVPGAETTVASAAPLQSDFVQQNGLSAGSVFGAGPG